MSQTTPAAYVPSTPLDPIPGWLAWTVQPREARENGWTPAHPNASVAILQADEWSETVDEGTKFRLLVKEGNLPLTLSEVSQIEYGCDDIPVTMAAFRTPHDLAEQVAWILPDGHADASSLAVTGKQVDRSSRTWTVGALELVANARERSGALEIRRGRDVLHTRAFEKPPVPETDDAPLNLANEHEPGATFPAAAFQIDKHTSVIVLRTLSLEGVHFDLIALANESSLLTTTSIYVYVCAY